MQFSFLKNLVSARIFWSRLLLMLGMALAVAAADWVQRAPLQTYALASPVSGAAPQPAGPLPSLQLTAQGNIPMPADTPAAHASTLLAMPLGSPAEVVAFWFAGSRESAADVQIAFSWFDRTTQAWMPARFVVNREALGAQLGHGVRRIGNPVAWLDASGRMHLFVVATGLGGWAAGRIVQLRQTASGPSPQDLQFEAVRTLPLSWLFNTSHLVRAAPMALADGGMLLPVYFELGIKYPVALHFGPSGDYRGQTRMSSKDHWLQPTVVATGAGAWLAFLRDNSPSAKIGRVQSTDAGQSWQDLPSLPLVNPDASVAAQALPGGALVLVHNPLPTGRQRLDLSVSADGAAWQTAHNLEQGDARSEFSYPALATQGGNLWVTYTQQRQRIAWQRFSVGQGVAQAIATSKVAP
jgi:predicted neuraminidase